MTPDPQPDSFDLALRLADAFAQDLREVMHRHNDFSLPETVVELLAQQLGVRVVIEDRDVVENVRVQGHALQRAVAGAASLEHRRNDVLQLLDRIVWELREQRNLLTGSRRGPVAGAEAANPVEA